MQIVIDIPDGIYEEICNASFPLQDGYRLVAWIKNGTLFPKGHGRLGDLDALEKKIVNGLKAGNYEEGYETFAHINNMDDCVECVKYAPTIIEADKK